MTRRQGASGTKAIGQHTIRIFTAIAAAGLAAWSGAGIAHADNDRAREACALMDDYGSAIHLGLEPVAYAMRVLSKVMPPDDAAHAIADGAHNDCPKHIAELAPGWM